MIPIKEAIQSRSWLTLSNHDNVHSFHWRKFRVKVSSFSKIDLRVVDNPGEIDKVYSNAIWWIMQLEVISLCKTQIPTREFNEVVLVVDQDEFKFNVAQDFHLCCGSDYGSRSGLDRFYGKDLFPKIKATGAISFLLPDEEDMEYFLAMDKGNVSEA